MPTNPSVNPSPLLPLLMDRQRLVDPKTGVLDPVWQKAFFTPLAQSSQTASNVAPATSTSRGTQGSIAYGEISGVWYLFVCVAVNTWQRAALTTW
jgi:hypothetical protein